ncbi:hypothetical protein [Streptomyces sp. 8N616]|uniref:hypothetical protein n=1 Tax=Streptomyces sp. 8N616 TaxID=3457414 RepID=UPI003FD1C695
MPEVFDEFHRVLAPGGHLLLAFQAGDEPLHLTQPFGHPVSLDFHRRQPDHIAELLRQAGLGPYALSCCASPTTAAWRRRNRPSYWPTTVMTHLRRGPGERSIWAATGYGSC